MKGMVTRVAIIISVFIFKFNDDVLCIHHFGHYFGHYKTKTCNVSYINSTDFSPAHIDASSIYGQCIGNRTDLMKIVWNDHVHRDKLDHYLVYIKPSYSIFFDCHRTKQKETYFYYLEKDGFQRDTEYAVRIETYPKAPGESGEIIGIGSCQPTGEWASWKMWSPCICSIPCNVGVKKRACTGTKSRHRVCHYKENDAETFNFNCKPGKKEATGNCVLHCGEKQLLRTTSNDEKSKDQIISTSLISSVVAAFVGFIFILVLTLYFRKKWKTTKNESLVESTDKTSLNVYISYLVEETQETSLLKLVACLKGYDIHCIIDLLCTVEINSVGGLPNWLPGNVVNADKVVVVLSEEYIKTLNSDDEWSTEEVPEDQVCKVHTEFKLINTMLYRTCQKTPKIVLLLKEGVKSETIPPVFRGMYNCAYPKKLDPSDDAFQTLLGVLLDTEPIQLA